MWGWCGGLNYPAGRRAEIVKNLSLTSHHPLLFLEPEHQPSQGAATYGYLHQQDGSGHHRVSDSILCTCSMRARRQQYLYRSSLIWWRTVGHIALRYRCFNIDRDIAELFCSHQCMEGNIRKWPDTSFKMVEVAATVL